MMEYNYISLRNHIENIVSLKDEEFAFVSKHFTLQQFKKGTAVFTAGDKVKYVYFVLSGLLKLSHTDESGKEHIVSFAMEDWWETDFQAYYTQGNALFTLACLEDTEVFCLSFENFEKLCNDLQKMERFFLKKSIAGHIGSERRILSFLTSGAKERYEQLLARSPELMQKLPKSVLASYLGVSRETLSRLFS